MDYDKGYIFYFDCDKRGRNTRCQCGFKNSNGGYERPFVIISCKDWNKNQKNDGIYAVPLTTAGQGNNFSYPLSSDSFVDKQKVGLIKGIVLCDKICRVSYKDNPKLNDKNKQHCTGIKLSREGFKAIKNNIESFMLANFW